jgi:hypothetical protein
MRFSSIDHAEQSRFHLMMREEPSLETLWLKNIRMMDKVQITDRSKKLQFCFNIWVLWEKKKKAPVWYTAEYCHKNSC